MYYIIQTNDNEYLFDYDLANSRIEVTSMDIEARQFRNKLRVYWIADRVGGKVLEIK